MVNDVLTGQTSIFDFLLDGNQYTPNSIVNDLIDDLENLYPGKLQDIEYTKWEHVPNLGLRLWLCIDDVGDEWDLTDIIEKYKKKQLEVRISAVPHFLDKDVNGNNLFISTMWTTKGHKEIN